MNFDSLMGKSAKVWFCSGPICDDQPPWRADEVVKCPTCNDTHYVTAAQRFQNLTTNEDGTLHHG